MSDSTDLMEFFSENNISYEKLKELEQEICTKLPNVDTKVTHYFADGVYGREIFIPAGSVIVGKIHKHKTLNFLMSGELILATATGPQHLIAPCIFVSPSMCKKAAVTITDVVFVNVHATDKITLDEIEEELIVKEDIPTREDLCLGVQ